MPWSQTTPMDQKTQFIADYLRETYSFTELCARFGVSRESGYKLSGATLRKALRDSRSDRDGRTPVRIRPQHTSSRRCSSLRRRHPRWGAKKLIPLSVSATRAGTCPRARRYSTS